MRRPRLLTLSDCLEHHADAIPHLGYTFLDGELPAKDLTFADLGRAARVIGTALLELGAAGRPVLVACPHELHYIRAFFGCLDAGAIAVPAFPPRRPRHLSRLLAIIADCTPAVALTTAAELAWLAEHAPELGRACRWVAVESLLAGATADQAPKRRRAEEVALIQYTSGSTSAPKGVIVTHANLNANFAMMRAGFIRSQEDVVVSWLPFFHDMGLIGNLLCVAHVGLKCVLLPPNRFVQKPSRWLRAISDFGATTSGGPNFGYDLCVERITPEERESLDLSRWRCAFSGSEPVRRGTLRSFADAFAACGFDERSFVPCYGMAEATLLVCAHTEGTAASAGAVEADDGASLVECGRPPADQVLIVQPDTRVGCARGEVGEIWLRGDHVAAGYWADRLAGGTDSFQAYTAEGSGPWFRSGDLGYLDAAGGLYVCGRMKDVIIVRGGNIHAPDLETTAGAAHPSLKGQAAAAFQIIEDGRVILCQEVARTAIAGLDLQEARRSIASAVTHAHDLALAEILLVKPGSLPRTSSGKIQRGQCREAYLAGELQTLRQRPGGKARPAPPAASGDPVPPLLQMVLDTLADCLSVPASGLDPHSLFSDFGIDSVRALDAAARLERRLSRELPPTLLYDYPTPFALARHLALGPQVADDPVGSRDHPEAAVAIVGIGCRFPGAASPAELWRRLRAGHVAARDLPVGARWQDGPAVAPGSAHPAARWRAALDRVDEFDAAFFGIAPKEAAEIDPQQRLLLEVAWEALEDGGLAPGRLAGSRTGVFMGISSADYDKLADRSGPPRDVYAATGNAFSIAANRISYVLDLRGPSMAIDTACSSSLVAVHQACQSLRSGESDLALAGGVNIILDGEASEAFARAGMLSPEGRCKTFDAEANGYVRGEGCGVVVLKRLADALRDADRVLAVVAGSAVNQDGRSNGLTAPNGVAQEAVIRDALRRARVAPDEVGMVEAHGTGTALGDPIEFGVLRRVFGSERAAGPCRVTSVKAHIGHLEAAAGVAGLVKAVLCLREGMIPAHPSFRSANPLLRAEAAGSPVIVTDATAWAPGGPRRIAGVSSFGFGGANAHVVVAEAPVEPTPAPAAAATPQLLCLSAKTPQALEDLARAYAAADDGLAPLARTAGAGRSHFAHRASFVSGDLADLKPALNAFVARGTAAAPPAGKVCFLFSGQGAAYGQSGRELFESHEVFRSAMAACDALFQEHLGLSLLDHIYGDAAPERLEETVVMQPCLFALEYALFRLWSSWGVRPDLMVGHSLGEYVAATASGVLSLEDAARLVAKRAALMNGLAARGRMAAVFASGDRVATWLEARRDRLSIAAFNGPDLTTISGDEGALAEVLEGLARDGVRATELAVSHAFHSPLMEPVLEPFRAFAAGIGFNPPARPIAWNLTGELTPPEDLAEYWTRHIEAPVRFWPGLQAAYAAGARTFVEIGPGATLCGFGRRGSLGDDCAWLQSLSASTDARVSTLSAAGRLYERGVELDWSGLHAGPRAERAPTYPFQRQSHWRRTPPRAEALYRLAWRPVAAPQAAARPVPGLVLTGFDPVPEDRIVQATPGAVHAAGVEAALEQARRGDAQAIAYVVPPGLAEEPLEAEAKLASDLLRLAQGVLDAPARITKVWLVTPEDDPGGAFAAAFGQALSQEHPEIWGGCVHVGGDLPPGALSAEIARADQETQVLLRGPERFGRRLLPFDRPVTPPQPFAGTALVTGGPGALGLWTAKWLIGNGCSAVTLLARSAPSAAAHAEIERLRTEGARVDVVQADVTDEAAMRQVLEGLGDLRWVIHAAGATSLAEITAMSLTEFTAVASAKTKGARVLARLLRTPEVRLVFYSSVAAVWGSRAQAHYAAANGFLDGMARQRRAEGLPTTSLNWGPWSAGLMTADLARQLEAIGLTPVREAAAGEALKQALLGDEAQIVSAEVNWPRFRSVYEARPGRRLLVELGASEAPRSAPEPRASILDDLAGAPPTRQARLLSSYLAQQVGDILGLAPDAEVGLDEPLVNLGMDSLMAVELQSRVSRDLRAELNPTLIFDHPTIALIAEHLIADVLDATEGSPAPAAPSPELQAPEEGAAMDELVAIELARLETALGGR